MSESLSLSGVQMNRLSDGRDQASQCMIADMMKQSSDGVE